jgi:hypothetical protein
MAIGIRVTLQWIAVAVALAVSTAHASVLVNEAHVVALNDSIAATLPDPVNFNVATAGTYTITLTDIGKRANSGAHAFLSLTVVIYQNSQAFKVLSVPEVTADNVVGTVMLPPGNYSAQVLGTTGDASLYALNIANGAISILNAAGSVTSSSSVSSSDLSTLQQELTLVAGRSYSIATSDIAFPAALSSLNVAVVVDGTNVACPLTAASTSSCTFIAGTSNRLLALASKSASAVAGLYSIKLLDTTNSNAIVSSVYPVGAIPDPVSIPMPVAGSYQLIITDLKTPDPLNALQVLLLQDTTVLANQNAAGTSKLSIFNAGKGGARLYAIGSSTANGGIYGVQLTQNGMVTYSNASVVSPTNTATQTGYFYNVTLPAAGNYSLTLNDLNFPASFASTSVAVTRGATTLGSMSSAGTLNLSNVAAGDVQINVIAKPNGAGQGLYGLTMSATGSATNLLSVTQGVGGSFMTIPVSVATAGTYALNVNDLMAPQRLGQLLVAVTRDTQFVGEVIGSASVNVNATPGTYMLNVIATTNTAANSPFGMFGIAFGGAPNVTLTPSATSVTSGGSVSLTWSSTDTTSCTASDGWSGSKAGSGTESIGPLSSDTKLTLTCSGVTGSTSNSVTIKVSLAPSEAPKAKGGGGAMQWWWLMALSSLLLAHLIIGRQGNRSHR